MSSAPDSLVETVRGVSRRLVRELGFMSDTLAGSKYQAAAVHILIELGANRQRQVSGTPGLSVVELSRLLNVGHVEVQKALLRLVEAGEVIMISTEISTEQQSGNDGGDSADERSHYHYSYALTSQGCQTLAAIDEYARGQVRNALYSLPAGDASAVRYGLQTYANSLQSYRKQTADVPYNTPLSSGESVKPSIRIERGYRPGLVSRSLQMHMDYYSQHAGFGAVFESQVAAGLADFVARYDASESRTAATSAPKQSEVWLAIDQDDEIVGTLFIDGGYLKGQDSDETEQAADTRLIPTNNPRKAYLRFFIVSPKTRGAGVGRQMMEQAMAFVDQAGFDEVHLWTYEGLHAARKVYEAAGFSLAEQVRDTRWGSEVNNQRFVRYGKGRAE